MKKLIRRLRCKDCRRGYVCPLHRDYPPHPMIERHGIPRPFKTAQVMTFWNSHGCKSEIGHEIRVPMESGYTAIFRLANIEWHMGLDWQWHEYEFVRYE
jgi:hypothetical protein